MTTKKEKQEKTPAFAGEGVGNEVIRTDELVERSEPFLILQDTGERDGTYGKYHSLVIKYEGEEPKVWNTGAWQVLEAIKRFELPIAIKSLEWKKTRQGFMLQVQLGAMQKEKMKE